MDRKGQIAPGDQLTAQERRQLDEDGYLAIAGVVLPRQLQAMRSRLEALLGVTPQDHAGTLIVNGLLEDETFDASWNHARVLAAASQVLGPEYRLVGLSSRGLQPGHGQQALHTDWGGQGVPGIWYACHAICALVDFTASNGATRVVPGSHQNAWMLKGITDARRDHPEQRQLIGPAGTVFILNIHCAHSAVHNASPEPRLAVFAHFCRRDSPLLHLNAPPSPGCETLSRFPAEVRRLLTA